MVGAALKCCLKRCRKARLATRYPSLCFYTEQVQSLLIHVSRHFISDEESLLSRLRCCLQSGIGNSLKWRVVVMRKKHSLDPNKPFSQNEQTPESAWGQAPGFEPCTIPPRSPTWSYFIKAKKSSSYPQPRPHTHRPSLCNLLSVNKYSPRNRLAHKRTKKGFKSSHNLTTVCLLLRGTHWAATTVYLSEQSSPVRSGKPGAP